MRGIILHGSSGPGNCTRSSWRNFYKCRWTFKARNTDQAIFPYSLLSGPRVGTVTIVLIKVIVCLHRLPPLIVCHRRRRRRCLLSPISIHSPCTRSPVTLPSIPTVLSWTTIAATHHHASSKIIPLLMHHYPPLQHHHSNNQNHMPTRHLAPLGYLCHFAKRHHHQTFLMFWSPSPKHPLQKVQKPIQSLTRQLTYPQHRWDTQVHTDINRASENWGCGGLEAWCCWNGFNRSKFYFYLFDYLLSVWTIFIG